jgi:phage shock protein PspC (stress-responsive transcriptional regulator)
MTKRKILGVWALLADKFGLDVAGLRILFVASVILAFGSPVIIKTK